MWQRQVEDPRDLLSGMLKQTTQGSLPMFLLFQEPPASFKFPKQFKSVQTVIISCYPSNSSRKHGTFESILPTHPNTWFQYMYPGSFSRFPGDGSKCCVFNTDHSPAPATGPRHRLRSHLEWKDSWQFAGPPLKADETPKNQNVPDNIHQNHHTSQASWYAEQKHTWLAAAPHTQDSELLSQATMKHIEGNIYIIYIYVRIHVYMRTANVSACHRYSIANHPSSCTSTAMLRS